MTIFNQILSKTEWDQKATQDVARHEDSDGYFGFLSGAQWKHNQLTPVVRALADIVRVQREALKHISYKDLGCGPCNGRVYEIDPEEHLRKLSENALSHSDAKLAELVKEKI